MMYPVDVLSGLGGAWRAPPGWCCVQLAGWPGWPAPAQLLTRAGRRRLEVQGG